MSFKDMVAADCGRVFLDTDYFGETARVEGRDISVMFDAKDLKQQQGGQDLAVAESTMLFYARTADLPERRAPGRHLNVNGREYIIDEWTEDMGMATVVLRETVSG